MALVVCLGSALGAYLDARLQFPDLGAAIVFLPYAVLTAVLSRTPPRRWWVMLLAAAAGDFLPHRHSGASVSFVLMAELANWSRAVIAAIGLRRIGDGAGRFDTLRTMVAYLVFAVLLAPAAGGLAGAATIIAHGGGPGLFWIAWQEWALSNAITGLTVLPWLMIDRRHLPTPLRVPLARVAEATLLLAGLLVVGAGVFLGSTARAATHPGRLYWPLPFLLWSAVRFGPRGTNAALFGVVSLSIWGVLERRGPFVGADSPTENLLELHLFLLVISVPSLLLAALLKEQRHTAAALRESQRQLQAALNDRTQHEAAEVALREAERRKDEFLATLGHELRNPLAPIGLALEIIREAPAKSPESAWAIEAIGRQLHHMTRLVDDLLDISRVTMGRIRLQIGPVDLAAVIAHAVETTRPLIDSFGHQLVVVTPNEPIHLRGDGIRLTQIIANLLNNAAKYTERGGRIELEARRDGSRVIIAVRDNGIGIPAEALRTIFGLFEQLPAARERAHGGLGIGLTLVKALVDLHGGSIEARSEGPQRGTEIIIRLPASGTEPTATQVSGPLRIQEQGSALRILAVDDNADVVRGLAHVLGRWGHSVRTAPDGASALAVATLFSPQVVLLDLGLPELDGFELARRFRRGGPSAPALLVSMSGFGQEETRRKSQEAGFHHHLVKPVDLDALRALLTTFRHTRAPGA